MGAFLIVSLKNLDRFLHETLRYLEYFLPLLLEISMLQLFQISKIHKKKGTIE